MQKACLTCGAPFTPERAEDRRCDLHQPDHSHRSPNRDRRRQDRFRREVLARDGHRCTYVDPETQQRCEATSDLRACHVVPLAELSETDPMAYDPDNGVTRCAEHDKLTDPYAR